MKKAIFLFAISTAFQLPAQSFYKGALVADVGLGFDLYRIREHVNYLYNHTSKDTSDGALSHGFRVGAQYGLLDWLGAGIRFKHDNYVVKKDTVNKTIPRASGFEIGVVLDAHLVRTKHLDLALGIDLGYSSFTYNFNDAQNDKLYGSGTWFDLHVSPRIYFGRVGFSTNIFVPFISYPNLTSNSTSFNQNITASWKARGFGMEFAIQYRFLEKK